MKRYERIKTFSKKLYCENAPITIEASSILKDNATDQVVAQVKFKCITNKKIEAIFVNIQCTNVMGQETKGVEKVQYLDINVSRNETFGDKKAIILPDNTTRNISVNVEMVLFKDGEKWNRGEKDWEELVQQKNVQSLNKDNEFTKEYSSIFGNDKQGLYLEYKDLWFCPCGNINTNKESECYNCKKERQYIAENTLEVIEEKKNNRLKKEEEKRILKEKCEEEERILKEKQKEEKKIRKKEKSEEKKRKRHERIKRNKKKIIFSIIIIVVIISIVSIFYVFIIPKYKYQSACKMLEEAQYDNALEIFTGLKDYHDSKEKIVEARYYIACEKFGSGEWKEACNIFDELGNYRNSEDKANEAMYSFIIEHKDRKNEQTFEYLKKLKKINYKDSENIYDKLYSSWKISMVCANLSRTDTTTNIKRIKRNKVAGKWRLCFHWIATGGAPNEGLEYQTIIHYPDGDVEGWDSPTGFTYDQEDKTTVIMRDLWYYGVGTLTVKFYDMENNFLGSGSVEIIN